MNLSIAPINQPVKNNVAFGMAKFSEKGYEMAGQHADIYESLAKPNNFQNPDFFKPKFLFFKTPFTKYYIQNAASKPDEVANTIIQCGTCDNSNTNAKFIKQLISTEKYIHSSSDDTKLKIGTAANEVFKKNWDNPEISKKETLQLLEIAKYGMDDRTYISLNGAIHASDAK